jgi:hypothetical protein
MDENDKKYIFLDVDGVLNSQAMLKEFKRSGTKVENTASYFGIEHVQRLNEIILGAGGTDRVFVIFSATMRRTNSKEFFQEALEMKGFLGKVIDLTGSRVSGIDNPFSRADEIRNYLKEHPEVKSFVIIDDEDMNEELIPFHIKTSFYRPNGGLLERHVPEAIQKLSS